MIIKFNNYEIRLGKDRANYAATVPAETKPEPIGFVSPKNYIYAPLKVSLLPTPGELKQALTYVADDPRPMMDILRKLAVADMHLMGVLGTRSDALMGFEIEVEPSEYNKDDEQEKTRCKEIESRLKASNHDELLRNIVNGVIFGHSVTLPHWELNSFNKYQARFECLDFNNFAPVNNKLYMLLDRNEKIDNSIVPGSGGIVAVHDAKDLGLTGTGRINYAELDESKFIICRHNPFAGLMKDYVGGLMRPALYLTLLKHFNILDWAKFNELFGMPVRVGKFDPIISNDDAIRTLQMAVKNLGTDAAAVIDSSTSIEFIESKTRQGADTYNTFASYAENKQSILILGQTLTTEVSQKFGSRSLGDVQNLVRMDKLWADLIKAQKIISEQVIQRDYFYNYGLPKNGMYPCYRLKTEENKDFTTMAGVVADLSNAGLEISKDWAYDYFGIGRPADEEDIFGGRSANPFNLGA